TDTRSPPRMRPTPVLLPYPTLFRSPPHLSNADRSPEAGRPVRGRRLQEHSRPLAASTLTQCVAVRRIAGRQAERVELLLGHAQQDRKSTRLNSSHVKISNAVFCLKN